MADTQFDAMAKYLNLPDGTSIQLKEGETPAQARARAFEQYPEAFGYGKQAAEEAKPESGFTPALKSGFSGLKSGIAALAGKTGIMDPAAAEKYIAEQEKYQQQTYKPTATFGEAPVTKTLELLGGSIPYMAAPIIAGGLAATAPVSAPVASALGIGAAGLASAGQFTGSNLITQMKGEEGSVAPKTLADTSLGSAFAASVPQAALDAVSFKMLPGIRGLLSAAGKEVSPQIAKKIAEQGVKEVAKDYALATGKAMGTEGLTEAGQQFLERMQAGLSLTDAKARDEYLDSLIGGVVLGGVMSPAGRYVERRGEAGKQEAERLAEAQKVRDAETAKAEAEAAKRQTPEGQLAFVQDYETRQARFSELKALKKPGRDATPLEHANYAEVKKELKTLREGLYKDSAEYGKAKVGADALIERRRVAGMTPEDYMLEQMGQQEAAGRRSNRVAGIRGELTAPPTEEVEEPAAPSRAATYANEQLQAARDAGALGLSDQIDYLAANPTRAAELLTERPVLEGMSRKDSNAIYDALKLRTSAESKAAMQAKADELAGQIPRKEVGKRKAPDYDAYLEALDKLDFDRREGVTESDIRELESLRRQTEVTDQGELFGTPTGQRTVLGNAPKTRQEYVADLRIARAAGDRKAAEAAIANLRKLDVEAESQKKFQTGAAPEFRLIGEQRQRLFESGYTEEQIDEAESRAQKSSGQLLGAGQTPMSVAIQQLASDSRAEAFAKIVDLVSRYNRGAAKQEDLNAARERLVSGLITDIQQSRGKPLTDSERQDVTRDANALLRELIERFGDTRNLTRKSETNIVSAQNAAGEFSTAPAPYYGYPTIESRAPGRQTFGNPLAAAQSIREGLEELRSRAITGDTTSFSREYTPRRVSAEAVQTQLERELAKDPKNHSAEQRRLLEEIGDNLRMMLRPESREDVSAWLYDLARDADNVSPELTQSVKDTLAAVEKAKRSETELETREFVSGTGTRVNTAQQPELPLGPGRELQRTELAGPQRAAPVTEGAYSQISTAPTQEQTQSTIFSSFAQLEKYLASDALQEVRSAIGLGRPTLARLNARLEPFFAKTKSILAKAEELSRQAHALEQRKRGELESLKAMSAKDMAAEERSLLQAKQVIEESKRRLAELQAPLQKELAPFIKEFEAAQKQFEEAVAAQEETFAVMLRNRDVFEARELAAVEKVYRIQERMRKARSKILGAFEKDFGKDPRNLSRMLREFKETGKQAEFNEQLKEAHEQLKNVFFDTRKDDAAVKQFLNNSVKFELQLQAQAGMIDAMALKLLDAGLALQVVKDAQLDLSANKAEILTVRGQAQEASRTLQALEAKQQERLDAVKELEDSLGLSRQEINHRFSEDVTVAEVLRASNDAEKDLVSRLDALMGLLNENVPAVRAYRAFKRSRDAAIRRQRETPAQKEARDTQQEKLIAAIGRDPASFEGERISFEKRNELMEELKASDEARTELEALIAATDEAIPLMRERIAEAEKELKRLNAEITALEALGKKKPRGFQAQLEQKSALAGLPYLIAARDKFAKVPQQMAEDIAAYERDKATAQSNLETLAEREADLAGLFSNDPEVQQARTEAIDKRIAKVETNLRNNIEGLKEKKISKTTRESREREVRKYKKELQRLQAQRSTKFGITRTSLSTLAPATQAVEAGERLGARKVGPLVKPTRTAGNIRTGNIETTGERKLSPRAPIKQSGKARSETSKQVQTAANAQVAEANAVAEIESIETLLEEAETNLRSARDTRDATKGDKTAAREAVAKAKKARDAINGRLKEAEARLAEIEAGAVPETAVLGAKEPVKYTPPKFLSVETLPKNIVASVSRLLPEEQIKALEQIYKAERGSDKFARAIKYDVVNYINSGAQSLARDARTPIAQIAQSAGLKERARNNFEFSRGEPAQGGQTVAALEKALGKVVGDVGTVRNKINILQSVDDMRYEYDYRNANIPLDAKAFVNPKNGDVFMFADNIAAGEELGVLLHEVGVHLGFRNLFNTKQYAALVNAVKAWARKNDGSVEARAAKKALARVQSAQTTAEQFDDELLAYTVEEAVAAGVNPDALGNAGTPLKNWLRMVIDTLKRALSAFGIDAKALTVGDMVNMAYGAAQLELRGTWHGSDAKFTAFDVKKAGAGEGAFDRRFLNENSLGEGPYTTPDKSYAEYYQTAVPFGKAANATGYGDTTYQDYRDLDERFLTTSVRELSEAELIKRMESALLSSYLNGVAQGDALDPTKNEAAKKALESFADYASVRRADFKRLSAQLSLAKIKGLKERPQPGHLYRALDAMPRAKVYEINSMHKLGDRPKVDAIFNEYGSDFEKEEAKEKGSYAGNSLFYEMREKLGIKKTAQIFKDAGIEAFEQKVESGKKIERAYIDNAPEILAVDLKPIGPATGEGQPGTGTLLFSRKPKYASADMARVGEGTDKFVAKQKSFFEKIKANTTGLAFETQLVDRFAGFERLAKYMEPLKGSQMMYYLRMYDQRMNFVAQAVADGAPVIAEKIRPDGRKEYVLESKEGANIKNVVNILRDAQPMVGNAEAVNRMFTMYLAALRADRVGLEALNFGKDVSQAMLDNAKAAVANTPGLKEVFDKARNEYNAYNKNMIQFVASTGAMSQEVANRLSATNDYIPFYREQNGNAMLIIGGENPIRIGNITEQPYLKELVGGDTAILDFMTSSVQNTNMLVDMGLRNLATKNAVFELIDLGAAKIVKGQPSGTDVVKFRIDGVDRYAVMDTEHVTIGGQRFETGVPADLLVKGMEGIPTQMPALLRAMAFPAQLLRKGVTLSPLYMAKQLFRDSLAAPIISGANFTPVFGALREVNSATKKVLERRGVTGGQQFRGTSEDLTKILRDISDGKPGWMSALSKAEALGMEADAVTRRAQYNSYIKQGLSEMEATLLALESMNFNKRGASPSVHMANALIPFMNAQIQGLNVLYKAFAGKMPFNDQLKIRQKLLFRGGLLAGATLVYAAMKEDDDEYKNARPDEKYGNWFIKVPGVDEAVRVPVPFEIGYIFKAIPEALYNSMTSKHGGEDAVKAFRQILLQTIPGGSSYGIPQALKPAIEAGLGKSFYTGRDILSAREKELLPEEQFRANTSEMAKLLGKAGNFSPIVFENLVRGYTGTMGVAFLHALSLGAPKSESPEAAVKRLSDYPIVGGAFQPNDAGGISNNVYERFNEDIKVRNTYKKLVDEGRMPEANALLQRRGNEIMEAELGDSFKSNMTKLTQAERAIAASNMSADEKRKQLDAIRKIKTGLAVTYREVADKTTPR